MLSRSTFCALSAISFVTMSAQAMCGDDLVSALRASVERRAQSALPNPDMGLPSANVHAHLVGVPRAEDLGAIRDFNFPRSAVLLESDLGPSLWSYEDLMAWYSLVPALDNPRVALAEINKIGRRPTHCLPGLLPSLCEELRRSREARAAARRDHPVPARASFEVRARALESQLLAVSENHARQDLLRFPWEQNSTVRPGEMSLLSAQRVLRALARATLVSHLLVRDSDDRVSLGSSLPMRDRMIFASFPFLCPLLPFAARFPFLPDESFIIGDATDWLSLLSLRMRALNGLEGRLKVSLRHATSAHKGVHGHIEFRAEHLLSAAFREAQTDFERRLQGWADEFRADMQFSRPIRVQIEPSMLELEIRLLGLTKLEEILFYYYVIHRKSDLRPSEL